MAEHNQDTFSEAANATVHGLGKLVAMNRDDAQFDVQKIFRHADRLHDWLTGQYVAPITLELDITLSCNDRCPRCVHKFALQERHLSLAAISNILAEAADLQIRGVTLTGGGDPLSHPEFSDVMKIVQGSPISAGLFTNGGLITTDCRAEELVRSFQWIRVSLDSASEGTFRRIRGGQGFGERLACLARLPEARRAVGATCELGVSFLTSHMVAADIVDATRFVKSLGFDYIQFKPMIRWARNEHHLSASLDQRDVFQAIKEAVELENPHFRVLYSSKKYCADIFHEKRYYSAFHSAWFVVAVGPSLNSFSGRAAIYLDCSSKYLDRWKIVEFESLEEALKSTHRREFIQRTSSQVYCVPPEKHAAYNTLLEQVKERNKTTPWTLPELRQLAPATLKHESWL